MCSSEDFILKKLSGHDSEVIALAQKALEFSENRPERAVAELLEGVVRQIISKRELP